MIQRMGFAGPTREESVAMEMLDLNAFRNQPLTESPFPYLVLPDFVTPQGRSAANADFPKIEQPGSFPLDTLSYGPRFAALMDELKTQKVREAFAEKFGLDLSDKPVMITVRGRCSERDGSIHTDAVTKIITVLIYLNANWGQEGGKLRLLRSGEDLDDMIAEVPPNDGTLITFKRTDNSWHGHKPFVGERRVIQLNWVTSESVVKREQRRHRVSAFLKRILHKAS